MASGLCQVLCCPCLTSSCSDVERIPGPVCCSSENTGRTGCCGERREAWLRKLSWWGGGIDPWQWWSSILQPVPKAELIYTSPIHPQETQPTPTQSWGFIVILEAMGTHGSVGDGPSSLIWRKVVKVVASRLSSYLVTKIYTEIHLLLWLSQECRNTGMYTSASVCIQLVQEPGPARDLFSVCHTEQSRSSGTEAVWTCWVGGSEHQRCEETGRWLQTEGLWWAEHRGLKRHGLGDVSGLLCH